MFFKQALLLTLATSVLATQSHGIRSHPRYNQPRFNRLDRRFTFPLPESQGSETFSEPHVVSGNETFDGGMKTFGRGVSCSEGEGGDSDAVFMVENGGTLKNLIIGADQIEGVHCEGSCTIENVWWEAVCEGTPIHDFPLKILYCLSFPLFLARSPLLSISNSTS
jgi:pectate lyase